MALVYLAQRCGSEGAQDSLHLTNKQRTYCRGVRRDLGLIRHACLAFMLVGDDGLWNVEEGGTHRDDGTETDSFS
jgi:hypothetical protein